MLRSRTVVLVAQMPWIEAAADLTIKMQAGEVASVEQNIGIIRMPRVVRSEDEVECSGTATAIESSVSSDTGNQHPGKITSLQSEVDQEVEASGSSGRLLCKCIATTSKNLSNVVSFKLHGIFRQPNSCHPDGVYSCYPQWVRDGNYPLDVPLGRYLCEGQHHRHDVFSRYIHRHQCLHYSRTRHRISNIYAWRLGCSKEASFSISLVCASRFTIMVQDKSNRPGCKPSLGRHGYAGSELSRIGKGFSLCYFTSYPANRRCELLTASFCSSNYHRRYPIVIFRGGISSHGHCYHETTVIESIAHLHACFRKFHGLGRYTSAKPDARRIRQEVGQAALRLGTSDGCPKRMQHVAQV